MLHQQIEPKQDKNQEQVEESDMSLRWNGSAGDRHDGEENEHGEGRAEEEFRQ
jgi:hypothetical protein